MGDGRGPHLIDGEFCPEMAMNKFQFLQRRLVGRCVPRRIRKCGALTRLCYSRRQNNQKCIRILIGSRKRVPHLRYRS